MTQKILLFCTMLLTLSVSVSAQQKDVELGEQQTIVNPDSLQMSILTCAPGPEVYALYGHMAIRFQNSNNGDDFVFNYGTFNMNAPFFVPKFTLGLMDYELGCQPFEYFHRHYSFDGCDITMQVLNLTPDEKAKFFRALMVNYLPENREYRYNFIYDNCATRPRDILEDIVDGEIVYSLDSTEVSYRQMLHKYNDRWPWSKFGIDLVLGSEADEQRGPREQEWIPDYLAAHFANAEIKDKNGSVRPLVKDTVVIRAERPMDESAEFPLDPMPCALIFLGIAILVSAWEFWKKRICWGWDLFIFLAQGLTGVILFVLFFLSEHPCTGSNWLILVFNPIPLFFLYRIIRRDLKQEKDVYHWAYGAVLTLFMIFFAVIPQDFPLEVIPLALILLLRHVSHVLIYKK